MTVGLTIFFFFFFLRGILILKFHIRTSWYYLSDIEMEQYNCELKLVRGNRRFPFNIILN